MFSWLDHRAGVRKLIGAMLLEGVPGGARWRYVWGSCLAFVFSIQLITGILLMTGYSPSSSQAWNSVHFIQYQMDFGWLIRGLHHFGSQTMMVLIALHMLQVVISGAHLPPRELNWWLGIGLLSVTLGLSLTGYLLPWDQKGYWATRVATNIAGTLPKIGHEVGQQAVGGPDYGNHTLTRFYALHVAVLPLTLILLLIAHIVIFRRHGVTCPENQKGLVTSPENEHKPGSEPFWPRQAFFDMMACMVVFAVMLGLVLYGFAHRVEGPSPEDGAEPGLYDRIARLGKEGKGAELDAAADRDTSNYPARPEWYFLPLFQLLKYFKGDDAIYGTVVIPTGVMLLLTVLPLLGCGPMRKFGHFFGVLVMVSLLISYAMLTVKALMDDSSQGLKIPYTALPTLLLIVFCYIGPLRRRLGAIGNLVVAIFLLGCGAATIYLFTIPKADKVDNPLFFSLKNSAAKILEDAKGHEEHVHDAEIKAKRACQLAMSGTPVEGGHFLLRNDPYYRGQELFQKRCGICHNFTRQKIDDDNEKDFKSWTDGKFASDLGNFGTKEWVEGLLQNPVDEKYFGLVKQGGQYMLDSMKNWRDEIEMIRKDDMWNEAEIAKQEDDFKLIAQWLAEQAKPRPARRPEVVDGGGQAAFFNKKNKCSGCHRIEKTEKDKAGLATYEKDGGKTGPELTNYGSAEWIRGMIMNPGHKTRYKDKTNFMPAFRNLDGPGSELSLQELRETNKNLQENMIQNLPNIEREMIIRWILRDYRPIYGGTTISK